MRGIGGDHEDGEGDGGRISLGLWEDFPDNADLLTFGEDCHDQQSSLVSQ
jgi:hypothetical protein